MSFFLNLLSAQASKLRSAIAFYTVLPVVDESAVLDWQGIAGYAPLIGAGIGLALAGLGWLLTFAGATGYLWRSLWLVIAGIWLTGGLHLDGAMDTADGLAVGQPERRLAVMADSNTGAFGAIALLIIFMCKWISLAELLARSNLYLILLILPSVWAWSRWGQLRAINAFAYLKGEGKGKFHQAGITAVQVWSSGGILVGSILGCAYGFQQWRVGILLVGVPFVVALTVGEWLNHYLGGQTGDTYGAIVEWSEALSLLFLVAVL